MDGSDKVRFCHSCRLNVYNISEMTQDEAQGLIAAHEGKMCIRMYRRTDGTVITRDCPKGLRAVRKRFAMAASWLLAGLLGGAAHAAEPHQIIAGGMAAPSQQNGPRIVPKSTMGEAACDPVVMGKMPVSSQTHQGQAMLGRLARKCRGEFRKLSKAEQATASKLSGGRGQLEMKRLWKLSQPQPKR